MRIWKSISHSLVLLRAMALIVCGCSNQTVVEVPAAKTAGNLELSLKTNVNELHPGETLIISYTLRNNRSENVLLAVNDGQSGGISGARTLRMELHHSVTGDLLHYGPMGSFCGFGQGLQKRHFHRLSPGDEYVGKLAIPIPRAAKHGPWRATVSYTRTEDMDSRQVDSDEAAELWTRATVVPPLQAQADVTISPWNPADVRRLADRISEFDAAAMQVADAAALKEVATEVCSALNHAEKCNRGFATPAVSYLRQLPFEAAEPALLQMIANKGFDDWTHQLVISALASFPADIVGPWAVDLFSKSPEQRGTLLKILEEGRFSTNDPEILKYMRDLVESAQPEQFESIAWRLLYVCDALGRENTREVRDQIDARISQIRDHGRRSALENQSRSPSPPRRISAEGS